MSYTLSFKDDILSITESGSNWSRGTFIDLNDLTDQQLMYLSKHINNKLLKNTHPKSL